MLIFHKNLSFHPHDPFIFCINRIIIDPKMMANLCCAIEMEPRTLNQGQFNQAREIAVDIVKNKEFDEATSIFSEESKPVEGINETAALVVSIVTPPHKAFEEIGEAIVKKCCQCSCTAVVQESPDQCRIKPAPF